MARAEREVRGREDVRELVGLVRSRLRGELARVELRPRRHLGRLQRRLDVRVRVRERADHDHLAGELGCPGSACRCGRASRRMRSRPVSCALISVPLMTIVVTWSSFAVVVVRMFARAFANEGSGAGWRGRRSLLRVAAAADEEKPQDGGDQGAAHAAQSRDGSSARPPGEAVRPSGRRRRKRSPWATAARARTRRCRAPRAARSCSTAQSIPRTTTLSGTSAIPSPAAARRTAPSA